MNPINIIGVGQGTKDLTLHHQNLIQDCDLLIGGRRHLEMFSTIPAKKIPITSDIKRLIQIIKEKSKVQKVVVLASGDPLFYGIGSTLTRHFGKKDLHIHPNISSVSAAFAAIKLPWHDARILSLHGGGWDSFPFEVIRREKKLAILTDPKMSPGTIAKRLIQKEISGFRCCVLEKLGSETNEEITWFNSLEEVTSQDFAAPNVMILIRTGAAVPPVAPRGTHLGMADDLFQHKRGLITKSEIRAVSLSKLQLIRNDHLLWDIGSGSGSVGIEASFYIPAGAVYAIEKDPGRISDIVHNINNFNCSNIKVVNSVFPEGIESLENPDRIFIGGGGKNLARIINESCSRLRSHGIIVINTVLLQNMHTAMEQLDQLGFSPNVVQIQVSRTKKMPWGDRLDALNPVWIISGSKP